MNQNIELMTKIIKKAKNNERKIKNALERFYSFFSYTIVSYNEFLKVEIYENNTTYRFWISDYDGTTLTIINKDNQIVKKISL